MDAVRKKRIITVAAIIAVLLAFGLIAYFVGQPLVRYISEPEKFRAWIDNQGFWGPVIYIGMVVLQVIIAFIPGEPFEIGGGYAFGAFWGSILAMVGIVVGSTVIFFFVRRFGYKVIDIFYSREKIQQLSWINNEKKLNVILFLFFFIPGTPKDLLTYFAGLTKISFRKLLFITGFARIPSVISSTITGGAMGSRNYLTAVFIFGITLLVALAGTVIYNKIMQKHNAEPLAAPIPAADAQILLKLKLRNKHTGWACSRYSNKILKNNKIMYKRMVHKTGPRAYRLRIKNCSKRPVAAAGRLK